MKKEKLTWKDRPTIINKIPEDDTLLFFIDESGEGTLRKINQAFVEKDENKEFSQRHDIYILNGITITGKNHYYLQNNLNKIKRKYFKDGKYNYKKYGERPILLRNHDMVAKKPPYDEVNSDFYNDIDRLIRITKYKQISAGINYYMYTVRHEKNETINPLLTSLKKLVKNYAYYLNATNSKGIIIFEEETAKQDQLKLECIKDLIYSTKLKKKRKLYENIKAVYFRKKWTQLKNGKCITTSGIELADLTISPIRRILHAEYLIIESKFLQYPFYRNRGLSFIE